MSLPRQHDHPASRPAEHDPVACEGQIQWSHICRFPFGKPAAGPAPVVS